MSRAIIWVHEDCLSPFNPALSSNPGSPALFVFDDDDMRRRRISLKRVMFIYECLLELPVVIRRGDVAQELTTFMTLHGAGTIVTTESANPRFRAICSTVSKGQPDGFRLEVVPVAEFVPYTGKLDLKRFSRYWSAVRDLALRK